MITPIVSHPIFFAQPPNTPNTPVDKKDSGLDEILDDLFRLGAKNLRRMGQEKFKMSVTMTHSGIQTMKVDIMIEDVEQIRQFLTPNVLDEMDKVIQPLISQPIHITPPNDDYVAPATKSILDELLEEFGDEILNVTMIDEEADFNPTKDIEELKDFSLKIPRRIRALEQETRDFDVENKQKNDLKASPLKKLLITTVTA
ncbi:hypothetical protein Tco_0206402 [Tanacetum coccineum]